MITMQDAREMSMLCEKHNIEKNDAYKIVSCVVDDGIRNACRKGVKSCEILMPECCNLVYDYVRKELKDNGFFVTHSVNDKFLIHVTW